MPHRPCTLLVVALVALAPLAPGRDRPEYAAPPVAELLALGLPGTVDRFDTDLRTLRRWWDVPTSPARRREERRLLDTWQQALDALPFEELSRSDQVDWILLGNRIAYERRHLELERERWEQVAQLLPFPPAITDLQERRRRLDPTAPRAAAETLDALTRELEALGSRVVRAGADPEASGSGEDTEGASGADAATGAAAGSADIPSGEPGPDPAAPPLAVSPLLANRAAGHVRTLRRVLDDWYGYRAGYDPLFSWWCEAPHAALVEALDDYATHLRETVAGVAEDDTDTILGDPIGREALLAELAREFIPYTPEELLAIAEREFAWCDARMAEASAALGFGDDWRAAQDHVKSLHVEPGGQPRLIDDLAWEAVDFLEEHDLLTVPDFAAASWRMEMMSPERQKYTPYFTGGEVISVSYPTADMAHGDKLMSMRGNNVHFSRATVHHELIPGHHLQQYMTARHAVHRRQFWTPFWGEGWALYWEMVLWDAGFPASPEDEIGMLFWRKHRCARILFSLGFHLGRLTPDECIALLTDRVGHELKNATAEVRRSVQGGYGPLYQAAYMLGGLQFRALRAELVGSGALTDRAFHDAVLRQGSIPVEMVRALLTDAPLSRDQRASWRFDG